MNTTETQGIEDIFEKKKKKKRFIKLTSIQKQQSSFQTTNAVSVQFQNIHFFFFSRAC